MKKTIIIFSSVVLASLMTWSCGKKSASTSPLQDEIDPVGEHATYYSGKINFIQKDAAKFPTAAGLAQKFIIRAKHVDGDATFELGAETLTTGTKVTKDVKVLKTQDVHIHFTFNSAGTSRVYLRRVKPETQNFVIGVALKRIDVNDMLITRQDRSTYYKNGTYSVRVKNADGSVISDVRGLPTKTGISAPVGFIYEVAVEAISEEQVRQSQTFTLDFTKS